MAERDIDPLLTGPECAALMGIKSVSWRSLVQRGYAPTADEPDADRPAEMRMPRWRRSTVLAYKAARPGQGARTDLRKGEGK